MPDQSRFYGSRQAHDDGDPALAHVDVDVAQAEDVAVPFQELRLAHAGLDLLENRSWPGPEYLVEAPDGDFYGCVAHVTGALVAVGNGDAFYGRLADAIENHREQYNAETRDQSGSQLEIVDAAQDEHAQARRRD